MEAGKTTEGPRQPDSQVQGQDTRAQEKANPKARPRPPPTRDPDPPEWLWKRWVELGPWETREPRRGGPREEGEANTQCCWWCYLREYIQYIYSDCGTGRCEDCGMEFDTKEGDSAYYTYMAGHI